MPGPSDELHAHPPGVTHVHSEVAAGRLVEEPLSEEEEDDGSIPSADQPDAETKEGEAGSGSTA